jgi:chromosome segregation ATPase
MYELRKRLDKLERNNEENNFSIDENKKNIAILNDATSEIQHVVESLNHTFNTSPSISLDVRFKLEEFGKKIAELNSSLKNIVYTLDLANIKMLEVPAGYQPKTKNTTSPSTEDQSYNTTKSPTGNKYAPKNIENVKLPGRLNLEDSRYLP